METSVETVKSLGKIMIELDLDQGTYNVGFSNRETIGLLQPTEIPLLFSVFHATCIVNELRRRRDGQSVIIPASSKVIIELNDKIKR
jgi:hypothetical protein